MRIKKNQQAFLRNIANISGVGFLIGLGATAVRTGVLVFDAVGGSNAVIGIGVVFVLSLVGGILEFD